MTLLGQLIMGFLLSGDSGRLPAGSGIALLS
jgi:hypothetical protein